MLIDSTDYILKHWGLKYWLRAFRSIIGCTSPDFLGTTKILLKNPGPMLEGTGSKAPFSNIKLFLENLHLSWVKG